VSWTSLALLLAAQTPDAASSPTFTRDVAPIVFENCASCHRPDQIAPFSLLTYADLKKRGRQIAAVVHDRYMPPWLPTESAAPLAGDRSLTDEEISTITAWVTAGMPAGDPSDLPPTPEWKSGWYLEEPDLVLEMPQTFDVPADATDIFRNFVVPVPLEERRWIRAFEFDPGNPRVVHHARIGVDPTDKSRRLDQEDPAAGFDGMLAEMRNPDGHFLGWTPGRISQAGVDSSWPLDPSSDLILQLHILPTGKVEPTRSRIALYYADGPPEKRPMVLHLGSNALDIPPGAKAYIVEDEFELPVSVDLNSIYPHAHYLGKSMLVEAQLSTGELQTLLHIPDWDFNWQDEYHFADPVRLPAHTTLRMRYVYDNSATNVRNPNDPPRRVTFGPNSSDEMADLLLQVVPDNAQDYALLGERFARKVTEHQIDGYQLSLKLDPDDPIAGVNLGVLLLEKGEVERALAHIAHVTEIDPENAHAAYSLAQAYVASQRVPEAIEWFERAIKLDPNYVDARANLGDLLRQAGRTRAARRQLTEALRIDPDCVEAHVNLGVLLVGEDRAAAAEHFRRAIRLRPDMAQAHFNLGVTFAMGGDLPRAAAAFRRTLELEPRHPAAAASLRRVEELLRER